MSEYYIIAQNRPKKNASPAEKKGLFSARNNGARYFISF
jgi:hypothetical protein